MRNDKFWDECSNGSIRENVALFIDSSPLLSKFKGEKYYQLEDSIVEFIENNKDIIFEEVQAERHREDIQVELECRENDYSYLVLEALPVDIIMEMVEEWQDNLADDESYCEARNDYLCGAIRSLGLFDGLENYDEEETIVYAAYIQDWFKQHRGMSNQSPVCISEFFDCEMRDDKLKEYYQRLAKAFKAKMSEEM